VVKEVVCAKTILITLNVATETYKTKELVIYQGKVIEFTTTNN
jgi:hypothetical protein